MFQFDQADQFDQLAQHFPIIKDRIRFDQASGDSSSHRKVDTATLCSLPGKSFHFLSFPVTNLYFCQTHHWPHHPSTPPSSGSDMCSFFYFKIKFVETQYWGKVNTKVAIRVSGYWWIFAASHLSAFNSSWNRFASGLQFSSQVIVHWPLCALCPLQLSALCIVQCLEDLETGFPEVAR